MCLNRLCLAVHTSRQLVTGLRHAKLVGGQLGGVHAIEQVVFVWNGFALFDGVAPQATIQTFVACIMKDAKHLALHTSVLCGARQGLEFFRCLFTQLKSFHVGSGLVAQLLATGLYREVLLGVGNLGFAWIAILGDEVTSEAGEVVVLHYLHRAFAPHDRFAGAGKVMLCFVAGGLA